MERQLFAVTDEAFRIHRSSGDCLKRHRAQHFIRLYVPKCFGGFAGTADWRISREVVAG